MKNNKSEFDLKISLSLPAKELYRTLTQNNVPCYGIKTDSIFVDATENQLN